MKVWWEKERERERKSEKEYRSWSEESQRYIFSVSFFLFFNLLLFCLCDSQPRRNDRECHLLTTGSSSKLLIQNNIFILLNYICKYSHFIWRCCRDEIQRIKAGNPDISHREAFSAAAKNVRSQYYFIYIYTYIGPARPGPIDLGFSSLISRRSSSSSSSNRFWFCDFMDGYVGFIIHCFLPHLSGPTFHTFTSDSCLINPWRNPVCVNRY